MEMILRQIADFLGGELLGDENVVIKGVAGIKEAKEGEITFLANARYNNLASETAASAIIASCNLPDSSKPVIKVDNPSLAFTKVIDRFQPTKRGLS